MGGRAVTRPPGAWRLPTLALLAAAACDSTTELTVPPGTRIVVRVQATDGPTAESLTGVRVEVVSGGAETPWLRERRVLGEGERPMSPKNLWLLPSPLSLDASQLVRVTGEREGAEPVVQIAEVHFRRGATTLLLMDLFGGCVGRPPCPADQTCGGEGRCVPVRRDPLPDYTDPNRPPPPFDASVPSVDATTDVPRDVGVVDATTAEAGCEGTACDRLVGVAAGAASTCAWSRDGRVWCWGADVWSAADGRAVPSPARVAALDGTRSLALSSFLCAARDDGSVACRPPRSIPASWQRLRGATAVSLGRAHACALLGDGAVRCAGENTSGQSGEALTESPQSLATVEGLAAAQQVSARGDVSCAVTDGRVACWGTATAGILGVSETDASLLICAPSRCRGRAEPLPGLADVLRVDARASAEGDPWGLGCAVDRAGAVRCWGTQAYVGLGPGASPTEAVAPGDAIAGTVATDVQVGERFACALTRDGAVHCWGVADRCRLGRSAAAGTVLDRPVDVAVSGARALAVGAAHACAIVGDRELRCWGEGAQGQLGDGRSRAADDCAPARVEVPL